MGDSGADSRADVLTVGAKLGILIGLLFVIAAAYLFWSPLEKPTNQGIPFGCSSAANPPTEQFPKTICGELNQRRRFESGTVLLAGLLVAGGGILAFGRPRRDESHHLAPAGPGADPASDGTPSQT